ncbi:MAG: hypothetical protein K0S47_3717 [Herbinix sp.]|jgi:hypothetical protein|nr:hypothetical protein [Herbinix sp.]
MKQRLKLYIGAILLCVIVGSIGGFRISKAASAGIEITAEGQDIVVGEDVIVNITIKSDELIGDFEAFLTYNEDILDYQTGSSVITGSSGYLKISDIEVSEGTNTRKYALKFEALKVGVCQISFSDRAMVYDFENEMEMSVSSNTLSVNVVAPKTASENAYLKSLKINPTKLTPAFDKNTFEYSTTVKNEVDKLIVSAVPEDEKATVSISGNNFLEVGENKVIVTVLAESGAVIEYTINTIREAAPELPDEEDETGIIPSERHGSFDLVKENEQLYAIYEGKYQLVGPGTDVKIPDGYMKTKTIISDISIDVYALEDDLDNDFILIYAMNELGEAGFYQYDKVEKTLQRYIVNEKTPSPVVTNPEDDNTMSDEVYRSNLNKAAIVIALLSAFSILLIIILIRLFMKLKGFKEDDLR